MGLDNEDEDLVGKITRDVKARTDANLLGISLGDRTLTDKGLMNIGRAVFVKDEILEKKKKKDESDQREAFKRAQEALERHLEELQRQIEAIKKQIAEAKKDILDVEEQLRKKYGDNWEEKFRRGEADKNDRLYKEWLQKYERLDELEKQYKELNEKLDEVRKKRDQIEADQSSSPQQKAEKIGQLARDVEAATLWETRTWEDTKGPKTSGLTLSESANPLQEKLIEGKDVEDDEIAHEDKIANNDFVGGFSSFASSLDKTEGQDQDRLSSKMAFNNATTEKATVKERPSPVSAEPSEAETVRKYKGTEFSA